MCNNLFLLLPYHWTSKDIEKKKFLIFCTNVSADAYLNVQLTTAGKWEKWWSGVKKSVSKLDRKCKKKFTLEGIIPAFSTV